MRFEFFQSIVYKRVGDFFLPNFDFTYVQYLETKLQKLVIFLSKYSIAKKFG